MIELHPDDALLIVDLQNDFLPGGSLAIANGDQVIEPLNGYLTQFVGHALPVFASRDWHPPNHLSFDRQGGPWPVHCVARSDGAAFPERLQLPQRVVCIDKATEPGREAYSAFAGSELDYLLHRAGIARLFIGGLATDLCVLHTALDALQLGYKVCLLVDAVRPLDPLAGERAIEHLQSLGACCITLAELAG